MLNVLPLLAELNAADRGLVYSKLLRKILAGNSCSQSRAYGSDGVVLELGLVMLFANNVLPTLKRVFGVFSFSTKQKMGGIHTLGVVACMT